MDLPQVLSGIMQNFGLRLYIATAYAPRGDPDNDDLHNYCVIIAASLEEACAIACREAEGEGELMSYPGEPETMQLWICEYDLSCPRPGVQYESEHRTHLVWNGNP